VGFPRDHLAGVGYHAGVELRRRRLTDPSKGTRRRLVALAGLVAAGVLSCDVKRGASPESVVQDIRVDAAVTRIGNVDAAVAALRSPDRPAARDGGPPPVAPAEVDGCVVHAGEIRHSTVKTERTDGKVDVAETSGACSMDAECVERQGITTPGDRNVEIACQKSTCTCTAEPRASRARPSRFRFTADDPCASTERVRSLLLERCVPGK
jgi:hypothetical protein